MKRLIKNIITFILHPIFSIYLIFHGTKDFSIGPQLRINKFTKISIGNGFTIGRNSRWLLIKKYHGGNYIPEIRIGKNVNIGNYASLLCAAPITIGDNCLIASFVLITSENHGMDPENCNSYSELPLGAKPVSIGNGCWIGEKVSIMPGVTIGEKCIVATNSVVTKSFPAYCLIAGIPAKIIKKYDFELHCWVKA